MQSVAARSGELGLARQLDQSMPAARSTSGAETGASTIATAGPPLMRGPAAAGGAWLKLSNWSIARKVWGGFGIVLALLLLIAIEAKLAFDSADRHFSEYGGLATPMPRLAAFFCFVA